MSRSRDDVRAFALRKWHTLLVGLALLPALAAYEWRAGRVTGNVPRTVAFFVGWELWLLWSYRRRRMWWFGPRY